MLIYVNKLGEQMDKPNINLIFAIDKNTCYGKKESKPVNAERQRADCGVG